MTFEDFKQLSNKYSNLIEIVSAAKEDKQKNENYFMEVLEIVRELLEISPYTHFYTQVLIDLMIKTYNFNNYRTDLLYKSHINCSIDNIKYIPRKQYVQLKEDQYNTPLLCKVWSKTVNVSQKKHKKYMKYFIYIKNLLIKELINKSLDLEERLGLIYEYSNNSLLRNLNFLEKVYLYEIKGIFNASYLNTNPTHAVFLDTKLKSKYIINKTLAPEGEVLSVNELIKIMKEKNLAAEEVYEIESTEDQIRFELFNIIKNNYFINKCNNCGKLFIPMTVSNNPYQKGRSDQKYCNRLYLDTGRTCREVGAANTRKKKNKSSLILQEYNKEYKRIYQLHYNHMKKFSETKFNKWSEKARILRDKYSDEQIEEFRNELNKLSKSYWKK